MAFITILGSGETVKNYFWGSSGSPSTRYRTISSACVASNRFVPTGSFFPTYGVPSLRVGLKLTPPSGLKVSGNRHERNRFTIYLICSSLMGFIVLHLQGCSTVTALSGGIRMTLRNCLSGKTSKMMMSARNKITQTILFISSLE